ncbi:hypothetical protein [Acrocarpospora sp. B8E8]|uniref:hypothetical protein n=1 Tax=Acrocarpospora sp. B8E8 TaxID=3153572 RepID=UPI00325DC3CE
MSAAFALIGGTTAIVLGSTYGLLKVLGGAVRVGRQAAQGARHAYRDYKATREIEEAEVIEETDDPAPEQKPEQVVIPDEDPAEEPTEMPAADLNRYDTPHERTTVNAEFTSFPQLQHDHETASDDMTQTAAAIDGQVASLLLKDMGRGELVSALMDAQEAANQLAPSTRGSPNSPPRRAS